MDNDKIVIEGPKLTPEELKQFFEQVGSKNILLEADRLTSKERRGAYGHPLDDYSCTSDLFTAILHRAGKLKEEAKIEPELAQLLMIAVKVSRLAGDLTHRDSLVDIAGYSRTIEMTQQEYNRRLGNALAGVDGMGI